MATKLKLALVNHPEPMYRIALKIGMSETRLSRLSTGLFKVKPEEKKAIAGVLNVSEEMLFSSAE